MPSTNTIPNLLVTTDPRVRPLVESWVRSLRADGKSPRTIENYVTSVRGLSSWCAEHGAPVLPQEQTADHLRQHLADLLDARSRGTVVLLYRCLQQWYRWLVEEDEIDASPMVKMKAPRLDEAVTPVIPEADLLALLAVTSGRDFLDRRDHAILRVFIDTGMRLGELVGLRLVDVDLDRQTLLVVKTKNRRDRLVPFGDKTAKALDRYVRARAARPHASSPALWLGTRGTLGHNGVGAMLTQRCKEAGIDHVHAHRFRHTAAHRWLAAGGTEGDLMRVAGWQNPAMLQRYGRSAAEERAREAHKRLRLGDSL